MMIQQHSQTTRKSSFSQKYIIEMEQPLQLHELLIENAPSILTKSFKKKFKKDLSIFIFPFKIKRNNRSWHIKKRLTEFLDFENVVKKKYGKDAPTVPIKKQSDISPSNCTYFAQFLLIFLKRLVQIVIDQSEIIHFLECMPQQYGSGIIHAQVRLKKLSGGRHNEASCLKQFRTLFCGCCRSWRKRFFTVTDECIFYTKQSRSYQVSEMLSFSSKFTVLCGQEETGEKLGIIIVSAYRQLQLIAASAYEFTIFVSAVKESLRKSPYRQIQRFRSFAGIRQNCSSKYYIDGQNYFRDLCDELKKATKNVYITDWMFTPYFMLKRPNELDDRSSRLDYVLQSIAQKGVKVYIILYMQPKIALNNDSQFVSRYMENTNKNIRVLRHPNYILIPFLWSHHEKMIVIDQRCAFTGGLDLCYGRWDTQKHHLSNEKQYWKGADYCNFRISDIYRPRNFLNTNLNLREQPRMPWHDIGIQIRGYSVLDLSRHFIQYWNFVNFQTKFNERQLLIQAGRHSSIEKGKKSFFLKRKESRSQKSQNLEGVIQEETQFYKKFLDKEEDKKNIQMPNFESIREYPRKIINFFKNEETVDDSRLILPAEILHSKKFGSQKHQILRSASLWSLGLEQDWHEESIYLAYQHLIQSAQHFIYIQNQFFICNQNRISELIIKKIETAYKKKQKFKVLLMLPLLPGFEGHITDKGSSVMRVQLHWEYQTICRGKDSLYQKLSHIPNLDDYLKIYSLRNHGLLEQKNPVTQILYIHSKLIIVDDRKVLLGSANINDRSLLGQRDSEIGIIVEDEDIYETSFGKKVSKSAHELRCNLYQEHFNLKKQEAENFLNEQTWKKIQNQAHNNTLLYRQIFACYPDDSIKYLKEIKTFEEMGEKKKYFNLKDKFNGFVVEWPLHFLQKQDLSLNPNEKQFYIPQINFT